MGKIFVNQTRLVINFNLEANIDGAKVSLKYINPFKKPGSLPLEIIDTTLGKCRYTSTNTPDFNVIGDWKLWVNVIYNDGKEINGEVSILKIHQIGT